MEEVRTKAVQLGIDLAADLAGDQMSGSSHLASQSLGKEGLLQTIYMPKNLKQLGSHLPQANYSLQASTRKPPPADLKPLLQVQSMKEIPGIALQPKPFETRQSI
jgi:hypothetical protein